MRRQIPEHLRASTLAQRLQSAHIRHRPQRARIAESAGDQNQARAAGADPPRARASRTTTRRQRRGRGGQPFDRVAADYDRVGELNGKDPDRPWLAGLLPAVGRRD